MTKVPPPPGEQPKKRRPVYNHRFDQHVPAISAGVRREICKQIVQGKTMNAICETEGIPPKHMIYNLIWRDPEFAKQYKAARLAAADVWADELRDLAAEAKNLDGVHEKKAMAHVQAIRLQVDTDKWLLSKLKREEYGDDLAPLDGKGSANTMLEIIKAVAQLARGPVEKTVQARVIVPELKDV